LLGTLRSIGAVFRKKAVGRRREGGKKKKLRFPSLPKGRGDEDLDAVIERKKNSRGLLTMGFLFW